jgi:hypothetical protein
MIKHSPIPTTDPRLSTLIPAYAAKVLAEKRLPPDVLEGALIIQLHYGDRELNDPVWQSDSASADYSYLLRALEQAKWERGVVLPKSPDDRSV